MPASRPTTTAARAVVLVVDADADLRELTATWLRLGGSPVATAGDPTTARELLATVEIGCVVVDIPATDGTHAQALLAEVRERYPHCRTVVTSVLDAADLPPADAALPKPFHRAELAAAVLPPVDLRAAHHPADPLVAAGSAYPDVLER